MTDFIKTHKTKLIFGAVAVVILVIAFIMGGNAGNSEIPVVPAENNSSQTTSVTSVAEVVSSNEASKEKSEVSKTVVSHESSDTVKESSVHSEEKSEISEAFSMPVVSEKSVEEVTSSSIIPEQKSEISIIASQPVSTVQSSETVEEETKAVSDTQISESSMPDTESSEEESQVEGINYCSLIIDCSTALRNDKLSEKKRKLQPDDGIIFSGTAVTFSDGDSVFDVLKTVCGRENIRFEFSLIPITGGAYIEGINNLYEFDCGSVSGWMYSVNGEFPNCGCSDYILSPGDDIKVVYSCNLGEDVGNIFRG